MARTVMPGSSSGSGARSWALLAQLVEDERIDAAGKHSFLVVLDPGPVGERRLEAVGAMARPGGPVSHLGAELAFERQRGVGIRLAEVDVVQVEKTRDL